MKRFNTCIAAAVLAGVASLDLVNLSQPAFAQEAAAASKRTPEEITRDMQTVGQQLQGLLNSEDAILNPAKRAEIAPKVVPLLHRMVGLLDEQVALNPEIKPAVVDSRIQILSLAALMGDAKANGLLAELARAEDAAQARMALGAQLMVRWWKDPSDAAEQGKVIDDLEKLVAAHPDDERFEGLVMVMSQRGAANDQVKARIAKLAEPKYKAMEGKPLVLSGPTVEGPAFSTEQWKGKVILVDFWATWCGPCIAEMPRIKKVYKEFHDKGLEILGVSCDQSAEDIVAFRAKHPDAPWPQLFDKTQPGWHPLAKEFGIRGIPVMFLIDKKGIVRTVDARENFEELIPKLLAE